MISVGEDEDCDDFLPLSKIPKIEDTNNQSFNESETCVICMELFTTAGNHKITVIRCGHVFGFRCIEKWYNENRKDPFCPTCKSVFVKSDIRPIYIDFKQIKVEDNTELESTKDSLKHLTSKYNKLKQDYAVEKLRNTQLSVENVQLKEQVKTLKDFNCENEYFRKRTIIDSRQEKSDFHFVKKFLISEKGDCRVMGYSTIDKYLCISCPSPYGMFPKQRYGIRTFDAGHNQFLKYLPLHTDMIRDAVFSPFHTSNLLLTCGFDKDAKLVNVRTDTVVATVTMPERVWTVAWSNNNNVFYAGLSNGDILEYDIRNTSKSTVKLWNCTGGQILSMCYLPTSQHVKNPGLLVCNAKGVTFFSKSIIGNETSSLCDPNVHSVLVASDYASVLGHTICNHKTGHLFSTFRPSEKRQNVRFVLSEIGTMNDESTEALLYTNDVLSFNGGVSLHHLTRSCFLTDNDNTNNRVVCPDESSSSVRVTDICNKSVQLIYPMEVTPQKPVIDVCQLDSDHLVFAAITPYSLYLYSNQ